MKGKGCMKDVSVGKMDEHHKELIDQDVRDILIDRSCWSSRVRREWIERARAT